MSNTFPFLGFQHGKFITSIRVYYEDTDAAGIVYYANYLKFAERARTEALRTAGIQQSQLLHEEQIGFVVKRCAIEFFHPARLDDLLTIETRLLDIGRVSLEMEQVLRAAGRKVAAVEVRLAAVDAALKPAKIPGRVAHALAGTMAAGDQTTASRGKEKE